VTEMQLIIVLFNFF